MSAVLATPPFLAFYDLNGNPLAGGLVYTYAAGTTTPKVTYTDQAGLTPMSNPIILDSAGRATWWLIGSYKYVVKDALGNTIATTDNVTSFATLASATSSFFQSFSGDGTNTAFTTSSSLGTDSKSLMVFVSSGLVSDIANGTFATDTIWTKGAGWTIAAGVATATGAISTAISQTATQTLVAGQAYSVTYTITASAGTLTPSIGGQAGTPRSTAGTYMETIVAGSSQTIAFTGAGFTGTLDNVTVNIAAPSGYQILNPNTYTISGVNLTFATAPAAGTNNIFAFAPSLLLGAAAASAQAADASATAAANSAASAATSASTAAAYATAKVKWLFSSTTTMAAPGTGNIRLNNASFALVTAAALSNLTADSGNPDVSGWTSTWDDAPASPRGAVYIFKDNQNFAFYTITGANVDNSGWKQLTLTYLTSAGSWSNGDSLLLGFVAYGATTVTGGITALTGDVSASGSGSVAATINAGVVTLSKIQNATANSKLIGSGSAGSGASYSEIILGAGLSMASTTLSATATGVLVQQISSAITATSTGATTTPFDDTIPQITEGNEFITVTITPTSATNKLEISYDAMFGEEANNDSPLTVAIFQDSTANALYAKAFVDGAGSASQDYYPTSGIFRMTAGTTSATTFRLRAGFVSGTVRINGSGGGRKYGGVAISSLIVKEMTQ